MDILSRPVLRADHRIPYGTDASQFGDLWLPQTGSHARSPVLVFFHGGWWKSAYDLGYAGYLCEALRGEGIATWSVEYRRVGSTGGGWPATFRDAASGFDFIVELARSYPLDLSRVITMGHSAGGHLAFWIAGRHHIPEDSEVFVKGPSLSLRGTISLSGAVDLGLLLELCHDPEFAHDREEVYALMGGSPQDVPGRYRAGDPGALLPFQARQVLLQGSADDQIPPDLPARWVGKSRAVGSVAEARIISGADHFDVVDPKSKAWGTVLAQIRSMLLG